MVKIIRKTYNLKPIYSESRFGEIPYGMESPKFYNIDQSDLPPLVEVLEVLTESAAIHKDEPSVDIDFNSLNISEISVNYKINDGEYQLREEIYYTENPYTFIFTGMGLEDSNVVTIQLVSKNDPLVFDTVEFTMEISKSLENIILANLYLIGEFEDGVDYYATPDGEITTDITGIYLGVGNADGDIDLDIIEYEMTMTYPAGSEEIGLDIPFNVTAATNLQDGREVLIYAKKEGVTEHIGTATVSGGAISESVSIPSSAFTAEDTVTIELNYASGAVTDSNDVTTKTATITNVTSTPASPEPATNFELSGESTYLVGEELTLQYSTDDINWTSLGTAVVQPDGTWSKADCQIADAGTYYLRAIYGAEIVESASISVSVASGTIIPTNQLYAEHNIVNSARRNMGDLAVVDDDTILLLTGYESDTRLEMRRIDTDGWTQVSVKLTSSYYTSNYRACVEYNDATTCIAHAGKFNYTAYAERVSFYYTAGQYRLGIAKVGSYFYYMNNDAKIYRTTDHTTFTLVKDLSAIISADTNFKPMTYDADNNYLHILEGDTLFTFDLADDWEKIGEITMPVSGVKGITYHNGRIHFVDYVSDKGEIWIKILKNNNDL